jgi:hypothetical protein
VDDLESEIVSSIQSGSFNHDSKQVVSGWLGLGSGLGLGLGL